jgi:hypothetical protein
MLLEKPAQCLKTNQCIKKKAKKQDMHDKRHEIKIRSLSCRLRLCLSCFLYLKTSQNDIPEENLEFYLIQLTFQNSNFLILWRIYFIKSLSHPKYHE